MTAYRLDGFSFNRDNLRGIDADALAGLNRYLTARERELNTIETESFICAGGPFEGQPIEVETLSGAQLRTAVLTVGKWSGFYEVVQAANHQGHAAVWRGNDELPAGQEIPFYGHLRAPAKQAKAATLGRGFVQLGELLATMGEHHEGETVTFTIGRLRYTLANTPEAIERLRGRILKAKKWFADKFLQAPRAAQSAQELAQDQEQADSITQAAARDVAQVVAVATAAAAIEQASAQPQAVQVRQGATQAQELATVGAQCSQAPRAAPAPIQRTGHAIGGPGAGSGSGSMPPRAAVRVAEYRAMADRLMRLARVDYCTCANAAERTNWAHTAARLLTESEGASCSRAGPDDRANFAQAVATIKARLSPFDRPPAGSGPHTLADPGPGAPIPGQTGPTMPAGWSGPRETSGGLVNGPRDLGKSPAPDNGQELHDIDPVLLTAGQVARWPADKFRRMLDHLEDCNMHGECLTVRALRIGREDLAGVARTINREHLRAGHLTAELYRERYELSQRIKAAEAGQQPPPAGPGQKPPTGAHPGAAQTTTTGHGIAGPAIPLRPDQVPPHSAWARWRAAVHQFDEIFSMPTLDHLTGAELQTLREACGLTREELGALVHVHARTVKHWENGRAGVPADVAELVQRLDDTLHTAAQHGIGAIRAREGPPSCVVLLRYQSADDLARYRPDMAALPAGVHGAIIGRIRSTLRHLPGFADVPARVVWLQRDAYEAWRQAIGRPDSEGSRAAWAELQVDAQSIPHRPDQPPPA